MAATRGKAARGGDTRRRVEQWSSPECQANTLSALTASRSCGTTSAGLIIVTRDHIGTTLDAYLPSAEQRWGGLIWRVRGIISFPNCGRVCGE